VKLKINHKDIIGNKNVVYQDMLNTYNSATGCSEDLDFAKRELVLKNDNNKSNNIYYKYACIYYEYMQFKRGIFKCTNVGYDETTGRVKKIDFIFTGNIH